MRQVDWRQQQRFYFPSFVHCFILYFFQFFRSLHEILSVLQTREKNSVPIVHQPCVCTPYVQESKKLRAPIFNKDERKLLARKNGNENPIWSWNESGLNR